MSEWGEFGNISVYCNATPNGHNWPVCARKVHSDNRHESADFWWNDGDSEPKVKNEEFDDETF